MNNPRRNLGKCFIFSATGRISKDLRDSIDGRITKRVIHDGSAWPTTDFYVQTASLTGKSERAAATMGAIPVVLPEGLSYLLACIDARCFAGNDVWLYLPAKAGDSI